MEEAQSLCQRVAIIDLGRIVAIDTPTNLIHSLPTPYQIKIISSTSLPLEELSRLEGVKEVVAGDDNNYLLTSIDASRSLPTLLSWVRERDVNLEHMEVIPATLEDVFLAMTGKQLRD